MLMMNMIIMWYGNVIFFVVMIKWCIMIMVDVWWWYINVLIERVWFWFIFMVFDWLIRIGYGLMVIYDSYFWFCYNFLNMIIIIIVRIFLYLELLFKFVEFFLYLRWLFKYVCLVL